ncbi:LacI family DNA-binding transcriptional regulator [Microbacterium azadirachtae]|uniref:LacI family DNA-binding transcriptional regulator n=1 Tax=Microbacterium azadirachtae TaxID=582680 RepID=UPI00087F294A|nr:LacI family DNA-binding transcriptional regulator [Microbacterium azadirachtae]SDL61930.1 DNA-binding transcriptional regulator, LacI/PurR family [Microbacterium azadirachtae]SEF90800.1 DNA-binding transcriptional regulator, LacI/PurR family [Microbacterium azadirachtae]SEF92699.1 DNA-binding transcriptional regulator, LacI/PurR family [Microbacterium azadirachtae]
MRPDRAVTLQDIADRLGVSRSTASFAITGRGRVSEEMRRRVHEVADELGYRPNTVARHLKGSRTGMLALRLPPDSTTMSYYMEATFGVVEEANRAGMTVIMLPTEQGADRADQLTADAVILLDPDLNDPVVHTLLAGRLPVITGEPTPAGLPEPRAWVTSEHAPAVRELMDHLLESGMRRPAMLFPELRGYWALTVRDAFEQWCAEHGLHPRISEVEHPAPPEVIHAAVSDLLAEDDEDPVDAIVSVSDGTVLSVVTSAQQLGRRVGEDLLVAALVDTEVLSLTRPSITAIDLHAREFGRRCVRAALAVLDGTADDEGAPIREVVPITVHRRASTRGSA